MKQIKLGSIIGYRLTDEEMKSKDSFGMNPLNNNQDVAPAIVTTVWQTEAETPTLNARILLDGHDILWKTSIQCGQEKGQYYIID